MAVDRRGPGVGFCPCGCGRVWGAGHRWVGLGRVGFGSEGVGPDGTALGRVGTAGIDRSSAGWAGLGWVSV